MSATLPSAVDALRKKSRLSIRLYNASDERQECQHNGFFYKIEPGEEFEVVDQLDYKRGKKGVVLFNEPRIVPEGWDAATVATAVLEKLEPRGVTAVFGDEEDQIRVREAKKTYLKFRIDRAKQVRQEWLTKVEKATQEPGSVPPPQPDNVRAEFLFLEKYERGLLDRKRYISKIDAKESDSKEEILAYHRQRYPDQVVEAPDKHIIDTHAGLRDEGTKEEKAADAVAAAPPLITRNDVVDLLDRAEKARLKLSQKETAAMIRGDEAAIAAVMTRLAMKLASKKGAKDADQEEG
jgi:hypothetical protein